MLKLIALEKPDTLNDAFALLQKPNHIALAGGTMFQLGDREAVTGVELAHILDKEIVAEDDQIRIPAMATLRALETEPAIAKGPLSILPAAVAHLMGPAFRNMATVGGAIGARFSGSELIAALLALDAQVELYQEGMVRLEDHLRFPRKKDIILRVIVSREQGAAGLSSMRNADTDQPLLCAAVRKKDGVWRVAVGARPQLAQAYAEPVREYEDTEETARRFAAEFQFGSDMRASAQYRRLICPVLIRRAMEEALQCG